jgi:hypothetical protein
MCVLKHKGEMYEEIYASIHDKVLKIRKGDPSRENLKKWFILVLGPGWRAGPAPSFEERKMALERFDLWYDYVIKEILPKYEGQNAMNEMYRSLADPKYSTKVKYIGWKIAGTYLRDIIYYFEIWPDFKEYLYVPMDRHVRNIFIEKLGVFKDDQVPKVGESYFNPISQEFHMILDEIHKPRVEFDFFWYIGAKFCSYHLCNFCWIGDFCVDKEPLT